MRFFSLCRLALNPRQAGPRFRSPLAQTQCPKCLLQTTHSGKSLGHRFVSLVPGSVAEGARFLGLVSSLRLDKRHSRPGSRAEIDYPATPGMAPRPPVHVSLAAAGSATSLDLKVASFGGLRMKKRSIICSWLEVLPGRGERKPTVPMPGLCRRLQRLIAGYFAVGIDAIEPAGCGSSEANGSLVLPVLAPALGVAPLTMVRADGGDLLLRRWGFHRDWMGWLCGRHVRSSCDDRGGLIQVTRC